MNKTYQSCHFFRSVADRFGVSINTAWRCTMKVYNKKKAFCLLKGRCRRMKYIYLQKVKYGSLMIAACCVLHNISLDLDDEVNEDILNEVGNVEYEEEGDQNIEDRGNNLPGQEKRDAIAEMLLEMRRP